jgi:hypothetical protein
MLPESILLTEQQANLLTMKLCQWHLHLGTKHFDEQGCKVKSTSEPIP